MGQKRVRCCRSQAELDPALGKEEQGWRVPVFSVLLLANYKYCDLISRMEEASTLKQNGLQQQRMEASLTPDLSQAQIKERAGRRSKKDNLRDKKKLKNMDRAEGKLLHQDADHHLIKNKSDQDNSATTHDSNSLKNKTAALTSYSKPPLLLSRLVTRPPYVAISSSNRISGDYGHSSAVFKRPIIEGQYFLEVLVRDDIKKQKKITYKSAVRIGICHHAFNCSFPLGCDESIAYRSSDGAFIKNGEKISQAQSFGPSDVIGVLMSISPPHKHPNPNEVNQGSTVSFFKNGRLIYQHRELKQVFYCFAVSLFNYSQVEILQGPESKFAICSKAKHYYKVLQEEIAYKDLESNKMFKI